MRAIAKQSLPDTNGIYRMDDVAVTVTFATPDSFEIHALSGEYLGYFEIFRPRRWQSREDPYLSRGFNKNGIPIPKMDLRGRSFSAIVSPSPKT